MRRARLTNVLFWLLASFAGAFFVVFLLVLGGVIELDQNDPPPAVAAQTTPPPKPTPPTTTEAATTEAAPEPAAAAEVATVVVTAARGDCWVLAREGSATGRILVERVLAQGESLRVRGSRVGLSLGASGNVDVTVDGKPRPVDSGTVAVVLTSRRT